MYAIRFSRILISFLAVCLVFLLAASASQSDARASSSNTSHALKPALSTTCPANGTARPAVMMPLALGSHRNIVYVYNEIPPHTTISYGHIKRYDVTTGQKTTIVTSGLSIQHAQVSADGQWVLFLSQVDPRGDPNHSAMLQLVRMDGQGLQTLYCLPSMGYQSKVGAHHYRCKQEHQHHHTTNPCHRQPAKRTQHYRYQLLVYGSDMAQHYTRLCRKNRSPGTSTSNNPVPS